MTSIAKIKRAQEDAEAKIRARQQRDQDFDLTLNRTRTLTGFEWRLRVGDRMVPAVGVFTKMDEHPADMLPRVLRKALSEGD